MGVKWFVLTLANQPGISFTGKLYKHRLSRIRDFTGHKQHSYSHTPIATNMNIEQAWQLTK